MLQRVPREAPTSDQLGAVIRRRRKARGESIEAIAERAEMDASYLSYVERGKRSLGWEKHGSLAKALDTTIWELAKEAQDAADGGG